MKYVVKMQQRLSPYSLYVQYRVCRYNVTSPSRPNSARISTKTDWCLWRTKRNNHALFTTTLFRSLCRHVLVVQTKFTGTITGWAPWKTTYTTVGVIVRYLYWKHVRHARYLMVWLSLRWWLHFRVFWSLPKLFHCRESSGTDLQILLIFFFSGLCVFSAWLHRRLR